MSNRKSKGMSFPWLAQVSQMVDAALDSVIPGCGAEPETLLRAAMRHAVFPGGKRLRPALAVAACEAALGLGPRPENDIRLAAVIRAGAAVELVHCYSLVHDDLPCMDDDDFRRGRPSCHSAFGEAVALLAGDALLTLAFELLMRPEFVEVAGADRACRCALELARAAGSAGMAGGQALELTMPRQSWAGRLCEAAEAVQRMESMKTGCLFEAAARMGGIVGGADEPAMGALSRFACQFGLVFHIRDDVEGAVAKDAESGRITAVSVWGLEGAREQFGASMAQAAQLADVFGEAGSKLRDMVDLISFA